ncbi:MAG: DNA gyrase inhibitor YacG [Gemmataceae bacterium]
MSKVTCPICGKEMELAEASHRPEFPFCGRRCKTIDLGRWLSEEYRIPLREEDEQADKSAQSDETA